MSVHLTVALLTYNRAHYLRESLSAIIKQTYRNFELLVLDNGSTDDTPHVVLGFNDERLRYIRNPPGFTAAFNNLSAMWICRGEWLLITHDDDVMEPDMLERQMALIAARPDLTAVWTNKSVINESGTIVQQWLAPPGSDRVFENGEYIARVAEEDLWQPPSSLIFRPHLLSSTRLSRSYRDIPDARPRHDAPKLRQRNLNRGSGDIILPAVMNLKGTVAFINAPLLRYRIHEGGQESRHGHLARSALNISSTLRRLVRKTSYREEYEPIFDTRISRFKAQDLLIDNDKVALDRQVLKKMVDLLHKSVAKIEANPRAGHPLLPLIVLLSQTREAEVAYKLLGSIAVPAAEAQASVRLTYNWCMCRRAGGNIFAGLAKGANIVILGSVLISAALIHEAREVGLNIVCCLDSSVTRQGCTWLGVQIVPFSWLELCGEAIDLIVLSSERDHEEELVKALRRYDQKTPIKSWKELVMVTALS